MDCQSSLSSQITNLAANLICVSKRAPPQLVLKHKLKIQGYNYTLQYEPSGVANSADNLSSHTNNMHKEINTLERETENLIDAIMKTCLPRALTIKEIYQAMHNDPQSACALWHHTTTPSKNSPRQMIPYYKKNTILIPLLLQSKDIQLAHEGHQWLVTIKQYAREHICFPGIDRKITMAVKEYLPCQAVINTRQQKPFKIPNSTKWTTETPPSWLFGLLPSMEYILVVQCLFYCFPAVEIITSKSASALIPAMHKIMTNFGISYKLGTDNRPSFNSQDFANFAKRRAFEHTRVIPYAS